MIELDTIYNQDCMDGLKLLPDKSIDLILTDPPYGKGYHNGVKPYGVNAFGAGKQRKYIKSSTPWDKEAPPQAVFNEMFRVAKNLIIFGGNYFGNLLPPSNCWIFWDKKGDIAFQNPFADGELIYTTFKKPVKKIVFRQQGFITDSKDKRYHPTQKPTELVQTLLEMFTEPDQVICDPFLGSGTTAVAAVNTGRHYIGYEIDPGYFQICCDRLDEVEN